MRLDMQGPSSWQDVTRVALAALPVNYCLPLLTASKTDRYASLLTAVIEMYDGAVWVSSHLFYPQGPVLKLTLKWEGLPGPERSATESKPQWAAPQAGGPTHKARQRHSELNITGDPSVFLLFPMFPAQR